MTPPYWTPSPYLGVGPPYPPISTMYTYYSMNITIYSTKDVSIIVLGAARCTTTQTCTSSSWCTQPPNTSISTMVTLLSSVKGIPEFRGGEIHLGDVAHEGHYCPTPTPPASASGHMFLVMRTIKHRKEVNWGHNQGISPPTGGHLR